MLNSAKFYEFTSWQFDNSEKLEVRVLVAHPWADLTDDLAQRIDNVLKLRRPDAILVIMPYDRYKHYLSSFTATDKFEDCLDRARNGRAVTIAFAGYSAINARLLEHTPFIGSRLHFLESNGAISSLWDDGAAQLLTRRQVVANAPHGCIFVKPSEKFSEVFIRAQNLLIFEPEIAFICWGLLAKIKSTPKRPDVIYVDTMAIHSLGLSLATLLASDGSQPRVETFSSYGGVENLDPSPAENALYLISASTSGSLSKYVAERFYLDKTDIITVVDVVQDRDVSQVLIRTKLDITKTSIAADHPRVLGASRISIEGEFFSTSPAPPRRVKLTVRHAKTSNADFWAAHSDASPLKITIAKSTQKILPNAAFLPSSCFSASDILSQWWKSKLLAKLPAAVDAILYINNSEAERKFAFAVADFVCSEFSKSLSAPQPIFQAPDNVSERNVMVVTLGQSNLRTLVDASRTLRVIAPKANRFYLLGPLFGSTMTELKRVITDLMQAPRGHTYQVECFAQIPVGLGSGKSSWALERTLLEQLIQDGGLETHENDLVQKRIAQLDLPEIEQPFLPSPGGSALTLTSGFAFWKSRYSTSVDAKSVFFTIAEMLQIARECEFEDDSQVLRSFAFETAVLAPSMFDRYSDGLIQAALLRAANAEELRYDVADDLSHDITTLIGTLVTHCDSRQGDAALEFILAIASGRLKITKDSYERLYTVAGEAPLLKNLYKSLLDLGQP